MRDNVKALVVSRAGMFDKFRGTGISATVLMSQADVLQLNTE